MRGRAIVTALALAAGGCGASSPATIRPGKPLAAGTQPEPQLALTRIKTANSPARPATDLIVVMLGSRHGRVVAAGSRRGWPEPMTQPVTWSPDGRRIAFARITSRELKDAHGYPYQHSDIFIINANGSGLHRLTQTGDAWNPIWSPDGREVAFARAHFYVNVPKQTEGATASIWTVHPNGSDLRQLTSTVNGQDDEPGSFSPNGHWLAFTQTEPSPPVGLLPNTSSVELLDLTNGTVHQFASQSSDPSFAPNGTWIALTSTRDHNGTHPAGEDATAYASELYLVDINGKRWRRLTHTRDIDEESPAFSPDGNRIAYLRIDEISTPQVSDPDHHTIYQINTDGSCPTRVRDDLTDLFEYEAPAWRPGKSIRDSGPLHCHR